MVFLCHAIQFSSLTYSYYDLHCSLISSLISAIYIYYVLKTIDASIVLMDFRIRGYKKYTFYSALIIADRSEIALINMPIFIPLFE